MPLRSPLLSNPVRQQMTQTIEITHEEIKLLNDAQLTDLLQRLLLSEVRAHGVPESSVEGSLDIDIPDGGEDASVRWEGNPFDTDWITNDSFFQIKATAMGPAKCKAEMLSKDGAHLKPLIRDLIKRKGAYILFCNKPGKDTDRLKEMREALRIGGIKNWKTADLRIYNPTKIATWTNKHFGAIAAVREWTGRPFPVAFQTWQRWSGYKEHKAQFVADEHIDKSLEVLRSAADKDGAIVRVIGLSGLGKTRLVLEAFRETSFSSRLAYIDATFDQGQIANELIAWSRGMSGILVVDNCSKDLHRALAKEIEHDENRLSLITMDFNPDTVSGDQLLIKVEPMPSLTIQKILDQKYKDISGSDLSRIIEFAEGFPKMAVLLCEANLRQEASLAKLTDQQLVHKLLWEPGEKNAEALKTIETCALFTHFLFDNKLGEELSFIAKTLARIDSQRFFECVKQFTNRGVIQILGSYARVVPKPLAWRLAVDWWERCSIDFATSILEDPWPTSLVVSVCDQLTYLHDTPAAREIAQKLCGPTHPFASAENLNTERGSRIFRSLSQVNPEAAIACIERVFENFSIEQLLDIGPGRRNLIWALENLCFWAETFDDAATLMLRFGTAENEKIGNNATNQFAHLFQIALPGTQASLDQRTSLLEHELLSTDARKTPVLLKAISAGLEFSSFHRTTGVEQQGGRFPEHDYNPTYAEIFYYWKQLLELLKPFAYMDGETGSSARASIARFFLALLRYRMIDTLESVIRDITSHRQTFWTKGFQQLRFAYKHEAERLTDEEKRRVRAVMELLAPASLSEKFKLYVSFPSYDDYETDASGSVVGVSTVKARALAQECAASWPSWKSQLPELLRGEQRQADVFGEELSKTIQDREDLIDAVLEVLEQGTDDRNPSLLGGFLAGLKSTEYALVNKTLDRVAASDSLCTFGIWLMARTGLDHTCAERALTLLKEERVTAAAFHTLSFGGVLTSLTTEDVLEITRELRLHEPDGASISLALLFMYSFQDKDRWNAIRSDCRSLLMMPKLLDRLAVKGSRGDLYHWQEFAVKLLNETSAKNKQLAEHLAREIVSQCGLDDTERSIYQIDHALMAVIKSLLDKQPKLAWPILGGALVSEDWRTTNDMAILLGNTLELERPPGLMFTLPNDVLIDWCSSGGVKAQKVVARYMPFLEIAEHEANLTEFAKRFLNEFGTNKEVLGQFDQNIWSFGWSGSMATPYEHRLHVVTQLTKHKIPQVRKWATRVRMALEAKVERSRKRDEEFGAGILDRWADL